MASTERISALFRGETRPLRNKRVVGTANVDRFYHGGNPRGDKSTHHTAEDAEQAMRQILGSNTKPILIGSHVGGNPTNIYRSLNLLRPNSFLGILPTRRTRAIAHITVGTADEHAATIRAAFKKQTSVITEYDGLNVVNTVVNGGPMRDTISLAPLGIPGGFKPDSKAPFDTYLTSAKGREWRQTYRDVVAYKKTHPDSILAFAPGSQQMKDKGRELFEAVKHADLLFLNKEEAMGILGLPVRTRVTVPKLLEMVQERWGKEKLVSITDGPDGAYTRYKEQTLNLPPFVLPGMGRIVDTIGAGDAYAAAFFQAITEGRGIAEAMRWGSINAAFVIRREDANSGQLSRRAMLRYARGSQRDFQPTLVLNTSRGVQEDSRRLLGRI